MATMFEATVYFPPRFGLLSGFCGGSFDFYWTNSGLG
jgi:hypothetical protein